MQRTIIEFFITDCKKPTCIHDCRGSSIGIVTRLRVENWEILVRIPAVARKKFPDWRLVQYNPCWLGTGDFFPREWNGPV